jgi:hypothetical protein
MSSNKTKPTDASVEEFINSIEDERKRRDSTELLQLMKEVTEEDPVMWGSSIVGFGSYHYRYGSGREGSWFTVGFSPRKNALTVYVSPGLDEFREELEDLGKYRRGKGCLYIKRLGDVDLVRLRKIIAKSSRYRQP